MKAAEIIFYKSNCQTKCQTNLQIFVISKLSADNLISLLCLRLKAKSQNKLNLAYYGAVKSNTNTPIYDVYRFCIILETIFLFAS